MKIKTQSESKRKTVEVDFTNVQRPAPAPEVKRDNLGRWVKGQTGNPKGVHGKRAKLKKQTIALFAENTDEAVRNLLDLMDSPDPVVRLQATKYFLDKGLGREFQAIAPLEDDDTQLTINIVRKNPGVPDDE